MNSLTTLAGVSYCNRSVRAINTFQGKTIVMIVIIVIIVIVNRNNTNNSNSNKYFNPSAL